MNKRRTHPYYLSDDEAAREERRTRYMVRSIVGVNHSKEKIDRIDVIDSPNGKNIMKVGETNNFIVDFDDKEKLAIVYGKEFETECPFKLAFDRNDLVQIVDLLKKTFDFF